MPDDLSGPNRFARDLFAPLPARYDRLAELLSFGQNGQWRAAMTGRVCGRIRRRPGGRRDPRRRVRHRRASRCSWRRAAGPGWWAWT